MNNTTRLSRLRRLRDVVQMHKDAKGEPVKLNGAVRVFDMTNWNCGTAACALGSYGLTPYGQRYFKFWFGDKGPPELRGNQFACEYGAGALHFGITGRESVWLFSPDRYQKTKKTGKIEPYQVLRRIDKLIRKYGGEP